MHTSANRCVYFGEYPQSVKAEWVTVTDTTDARGYYLGSDGCYYARMTASPDVWQCDSFDDRQKIEMGKDYFFKVEPIKWRVLSAQDGTELLFCDNILEKHVFDKDYRPWATSEIRAFLNGEFYEVAFTAEQKARITETVVDNSVASMGSLAKRCKMVDGENTRDKVFLLSYADVTNKAYGFTHPTVKRTASTEYARARGARTYEFPYYGCWWLRSPYESGSTNVCEVNLDGVHCSSTNVPYLGVVPALRIRL